MKSMQSPPDVKNCCPSDTQVTQMSVYNTHPTGGWDPHKSDLQYIYLPRKWDSFSGAGRAIRSTQPLIKCRLGPLYPGVQQLSHETNHPPQSSVGVKNMRSCISILLSIMVWCLIRNRHFYLYPKKWNFNHLLQSKCFKYLQLLLIIS
jgi:hypothetical protein